MASASSVGLPEIDGLILSGGRATRMGGRDKGLALWRGQELVKHVLLALAPQVGQVRVSANRNQERYAELCRCPVLGDDIPGFQGPLAGIAAALKVSDAPCMAVAPCDAPCLPRDLVARLLAGMGDRDIAVAHDGARLQPLHLLLRARAGASLHAFIQDGGRKPDAWYRQHGHATVDFADCPDAFINFNALQDLS